MNLMSVSTVCEPSHALFRSGDWSSMKFSCLRWPLCHSNTGDVAIGCHWKTWKVSPSNYLTRTSRRCLVSLSVKKLLVPKRSDKFLTHLLTAGKNGTLSCSEDGHNFENVEAVEVTDTNTEVRLREGGGKIAEVCGILTAMFPVWVVLAAGLALIKPAMFTWFKGQLLVSGVALTMLGMGTTLSMNDFQGAAAMRKEFLAGVVLQYTVMPFLGAMVAATLGLPHYYAVGIVLVSSCPGGTASNIVTYLARGNVALSVLMTATSTMLAVVMTPILTAKLAGQLVPVNAQALFLSTLQVVLLPVLGGAMLAQYFPRQVAVVGPFAPLVAAVTVALICASCIGQSAGAIMASGTQLLAAVLLLHGGGFFLGYILSTALGFDRKTSRTISIEVGMQNSVLGVVLATQNFPNPLTAAPCAISSVCHSVLGSLLASAWYLQETRRASPSAA